MKRIFLNIKIKFNDYLKRSNWEYLFWGIIVLGIILRVSQYLFNRSLWLDESYLALNIVNKNYLDFFKPLDYHQAAPFLFLVLEKLAIQTLGNSDIVLRLFPLIAGIVSLFLFYKVADFNLDKKGTLIALGLFALSDPLIYYSSELKQYSTDVMVLLIILLMTYLVIEKKSNWHFILFAVIGTILIWFSHPALLTLPAIGISLGIYYWVKKDKKSFIKLLCVTAVWLLSFSILYFVTLRFLAHDRFMENYWSQDFLPRNPFSKTINFVDWYLENTFGIFQYPTGLFFSGIACLAFVIGVVSFYRTKKLKLLILYSPIIITAVASLLRKYPFENRLILFLVPIILLIIGEGIKEFFNYKLVNTKLLGILVLILIFMHPFVNDVRYVFNPRTRNEIKPVMNYLSESRQKGDTIFLYHFGETAVEYYAPKYGFNRSDFIVDNDHNRDFDNIDKYNGTKRFWILFAYTSSRFPYAKEIYLSYLRHSGKELKSFSADGASVYLFDLSKSDRSK